MKAKFDSFICDWCHSSGVVCAVAILLQLGVLAGSAQTNIYLYTGSKTNITLAAGTYIITAYGARAGSSWNCNGTFGAEMQGEFTFSGPTTLTLLVGGGGGGIVGSTMGSGGSGGYSGGGGGFTGAGSDGSGTISGGGGGSSFLSGGSGGSGGYGDNYAVGGYGGGGGGGGLQGSGGDWGYGGGGGGGYSGGGGGGGSIIDSSAITNLAEVSAIASPDGSPNGEIIITTVSTGPALGITTISSLPVVVWPASATNCVLQMATNLSSGPWVTVTNGIPFCGLQITNAAGATFFRLNSTQ